MTATKAQRRYLAVLFFHSLSNEAHRDLKKKIQNDVLTGSDAVPHTCNKVLKLADQCESSYQQCNPGGERGGGIAFTQKGKAAAGEALATALTASATAAAAAAAKDASIKHKPHPVPGEKDNKGKMFAISAGKKTALTVAVTITGLSTALI